MTYIKKKGQTMNEMFEINNIINMKNENDVNASHLKQLIENPIVQQHSFLLNNIKTSTLFKTKPIPTLK